MNKKSSKPYNYREVAKSLGARYLFGRWGLSLGSKLPEGHRIFKPRLIPLDGWILEKECVMKEMEKRDFEL